MHMRGFGLGLRALRAARRLTQRDIARTVLGDVDDRRVADFANYMSRVERETGDARNPSLLLLEQYAQGLGLTLSAMFGEIEAIASQLQPSHLKSVPGPSMIDPRASSTPARGAFSDESRRSAISAAVRLDDIQRISARFAALEADLARERETVKRLAARVDRSAEAVRKRAGNR